MKSLHFKVLIKVICIPGPEKKNLKIYNNCRNTHTYIYSLWKSQTNMDKIMLACVPFAKPFTYVADVSITDMWWNMLIIQLKTGAHLGNCFLNCWCPSWRLPASICFSKCHSNTEQGNNGSLKPRANEQWSQLKLPTRGSMQWFRIFTVLTAINCNDYSGFVSVEKKHNESRSE